MTSINPNIMSDLQFVSDKTLIGHIEKENEKTKVYLDDSGGIYIKKVLVTSVLSGNRFGVTMQEAIQYMKMNYRWFKPNRS